MLQTICEDFQAANYEPIVPVDCRFGSEFTGRKVPVNSARDVVSVLRRLAKEANCILIIAPETGGCLLQCLDWMQDFKGKLLNPGYEFTKLASDKNSLQEFLDQQQVPVPSGGKFPDWLMDNRWSCAQQYVLKPSDGCGGENLKLIKSPIDVEFQSLPAAASWRVEEFAEGIATSVSVIGSACFAPLILPPLRQAFDREPIGRFARCVADLSGEISRRATELASKTVRVLPNPVGFFGVDMVIGIRDVVIEVNPRITLSYCCLRQIVEFNLAARMVDSFSSSAEFSQIQPV